MTQAESHDKEAGGIPDSFQFVDVRQQGRVTVVTINRPEVLNALHAPAHRELARVFDRFAEDETQWIAVLTGAGRAFCAGNDLKFQSKGGRIEYPPSGFGGLATRFDLSKPVIAAVNGIAMGGGFELVLACDIVIATDNAVFALPEPKVGTAALTGGLHRLPRLVGWQRAMEMILTGRKASATDGENFGFVNRVVRPDQLMTEAISWAQEICECSPLSIRASKQVAAYGLTMPSLEEAMTTQREQPAVVRMLNSADYREGSSAFVEKRKPVWIGR